MKMRIGFSIDITFYLMCVIGVIVLLYINNKTHTESTSTRLAKLNKEKKTGYNYILLWTSRDNVPFCYLSDGQSAFVSRKCLYTNCIVTSNPNFLSNYSLFDVIVFHGPELHELSTDDLPINRSPHQKYVFASIESSAYYPICSDKFNGYFNWTWTYKFKSDVRWGYIVIRDTDGNIVGPNKDMHWIYWDAMDRVSDKMKEQLKNKTKVAAWFVSNCDTMSRREYFVQILQKYLHKVYKRYIDVFGDCGQMVCPRESGNKCNKIIEDYYFYLSFENAFSAEYVTEKLLIPLQNKAIPIVYGGANYSQFLPNGSYLNARELGIKALGDKMMALINDPEQYAEYFRWKNHYSYHKTSESIETDEYCNICALLNSNKMKTVSVYQNLREWWDPHYSSCLDT